MPLTAAENMPVYGRVIRINKPCLISRGCPLCLLLVVLLFLITAGGIGGFAESGDIVGIARAVGESAFDEGAEKALAVFIGNIWNETGQKPDSSCEIFRIPARAVYVGARSKGVRVARAWESADNTAETLTKAVLKVKGEAAKTNKVIDMLETVLFDSCEALDLPGKAGSQAHELLDTNIRRGTVGLEINYGDYCERISPTETVASNRSHKKILDLFIRKYIPAGCGDLSSAASISIFTGRQFLVRIASYTSAFEIERGNRFIDPAEVNRKNVEECARMAMSWMRNNVHDDGRMTYKFWPASGRESPSNNMIRQWMATHALVRIASESGGIDDEKLATGNLEYNLKHFYREENGFGLIEYEGQVKLGALAIAALAILEHPHRRKWYRQELALQRTIESLHNPNGAFTCFFKPKGENRNQNFYPGEALLYWATLYDRERNPELLKRFKCSFEYYRAWHLDPKNRNPAFIPWHTQACYIIWKITGDEELKRFIYEMNDWLLPIQQWKGSVSHNDALGRFYDPGRPFGPPHVSSTGVYIEGLADAFDTARRDGDAARMHLYRIAISRGLRSLLQLQFTDEIDMFYISHKLRKYVFGGFRTTAYDSEIRCDNVQHALLGLIKVLDLFSPNDYITG